MPGLEDLQLRRQLAEGRRVAVDRPALARRCRLAVDGVADHVPDPAERLVADGNRDRPAGVDDVGSAREAVGRVHRHRAHAVVAEMLLHLRDQLDRALAVGRRRLDAERVVDLGQLAREHGVEHDALDLDDLAGVAAVLRLVGHESPGAWAGMGTALRKRLPKRAESSRMAPAGLPATGV